MQPWLCGLVIYKEWSPDVAITIATLRGCILETTTDLATSGFNPGMIMAHPPPHKPALPHGVVQPPPVAGQAVPCVTTLVAACQP